MDSPRETKTASRCGRQYKTHLRARLMLVGNVVDDCISQLLQQRVQNLQHRWVDGRNFGKSMRLQQRVQRASASVARHLQQH